jgi:aryl-alcohol dehydrogenase-like predicted oxidoreductase
VRQLARKYGVTAEQVFFAFVRSLGVTPLTGSSSAEHLRQDLDALALQLDPADLQVVHALLH